MVTLLASVTISREIERTRGALELGRLLEHKLLIVVISDRACGGVATLPIDFGAGISLL